MAKNNENEKDTAQELGKMEKPEASIFKKGRKLIFVPLVFSRPEHDSEYDKLYEKYWQQVGEQVSNLEGKLVDVTRVYHEFIALDGDDGVKEIEMMGTGSIRIIKPLVKKGAKIMAAESMDLLGEFMDWSKCLSTRISNQSVITKLLEFYNEVLKKREEWIGKSIDFTLGSDEFGLLFMRENHKVQFPSDIEVFYVAPPSLDEIKRWVREEKHDPEAVKKEEKPAEKKAVKKSAAKKPVAKKTSEKKEK